MAMQDRRLTVESKAIYAYICSFAGAGTTAFPSRDKILGDLKISKDRYYRHFNLLKYLGYIKVNQTADSEGKFKRNIYVLVENVPTSTPCHCFEDTDNPCHCFTDTDNKDAIININKINNYKEVISMSKSHGNGIDLDYETYKKIIHKNIEYSYFEKNDRYGELRLVDELVNCMLDVITTKEQNIKINGELKDRLSVIKVYLTIDSADIRHVMSKYKEQAEKITHISSYLKTLLYNVKQEYNFFRENEYSIRKE